MCRKHLILYNNCLNVIIIFTFILFLKNYSLKMCRKHVVLLNNCLNVIVNLFLFLKNSLELRLFDVTFR